MRRSGAPSQLLGNQLKKSRFVAPAPSNLNISTHNQLFTPKHGSVDVLDKVHSTFFTFNT